MEYSYTTLILQYALPFPDDPGLAVGEGGSGVWPQMAVFEELEQLLGEELAEGEEVIEEGGGEPTLPTTELPVPVGTGTSSLPYELTETDYCGNFSTRAKGRWP